MVKLRLTGILIMSFIATCVFANKPTVCPSTSSIKETGLSNVEQINTVPQYAAYHISLFNTEETWTFVIFPINADSKEQALYKGNQLLPTLSGNPSPEGGDGTWFCDYQLGNYFATAFIDNGSMSRYKIRQYLNR